MITVKKYFNQLYSNRRIILIVVISSLLIVMFQNCGGAGTSNSTGGASIISSTPNPDPLPGPGPLPGPLPGPSPLPGALTNGACGTINDSCTSGTLFQKADTTSNLLWDCVGLNGGATANCSIISPAQQKINCSSALAASTINETFSTAAAISSGLGSNKSGDSATTPSFAITVDKAITNAAVFTAAANACNTGFTVTLQCDVMDNPSFPTDIMSITSVTDVSGNSLLPLVAPMTTLDLAKAAFINNNNNCNGRTFVYNAATPPVGSTTFNIKPNTGVERCVEGSFWVRLTAETKGTNLNTLTSAAKYIKINVTNGCWAETRLKDKDGPFGRVINFGDTVAMDGNWAAVVAPTDDASPAVLDVGSVYLYKLETNGVWTQKQSKIQMPGATAGDTIASVAIRGNTMVIGSPNNNSGKGVAYFYQLAGDTWTFVSVINPSSNIVDQNFGRAVALNDSYIFIGAPNYSSTTMINNGSVSIFSYTSAGATYANSLYGALAYTSFGASIAVDNSVLAIGAPQTIGYEPDRAGSVFVYNISAATFTLAATKTGSKVAEKFGTSVAVYGSHLAVGSPNYTATTIYGFGQVTYYDNYAVTAATKTFMGASATDNLGQSVALSSTGLYIGVPFATARAGRVDHYLYANIVAGTLYFTNLAYNQTAPSAFGWSVAASGNNVIIGARIKSDSYTSTSTAIDNSGAAYIFKFK